MQQHTNHLPSATKYPLPAVSGNRFDEAQNFDSLLGQGLRGWLTPGSSPLAAIASWRKRMSSCRP